MRLFQGAEFIVAPNGSSIHNLIFSNPNVKAVILCQQNFHNWGGWVGPMIELGYSPVFLSGQRVKAEDNKHSDYTISAAKVKETVIKMLETQVVEYHE